MLLAVAYHYVADEAPSEPRAIFPVTREALERQVELLARSFELVSRDRLLAAAAGEGDLPERACVLTFDDGLRCQVDTALPVLERLGAPAVFFVPGQPLEDPRVLAVHKVQAMRERLGDRDFAERLHETLAELGIEPPAISDEDAASHYRYDTVEAARAKFLLNAALPPEVRREVVDALFRRELADEHAFAEELYMSRDQVAELERSHRAVGAHSYGHEPLAGLSPAELDRDLERVSGLLEEITGARPRAFSYPYGGDSAVDVPTARRLGAAGYRAAFTMERALNRTLAEPLLLARLDTNDAPGGARPLLELQDGELAAAEGVSLSRARHFDEAASAP